MIRLALAILLATALCADDAAPPAPLAPDVVAEVGGKPIPLALLELELLRREGADAVVQWVSSSLEELDWAKLPDDSVVMQVGAHQLRKRDLVDMLLAGKAAAVREELVSIAVVNQAVAKAGIAVDDALLASEYRLMERSFQRKRTASGQGYLDFASFLRVKEHMDSEQFLAQPAVRMLAGLHELVRRRLRTEFDDAKLQAKLDAERARWDLKPAVDLSVIHVPWKKDEQGRVSEEERVRLQSVMNIIAGQIRSRQTTFTKAWEAFGKSWDASGPDGHVGWVDHDGKRQDGGERRIPVGLLDRAFAFEGQLPALLPPHAHDGGVDLALLQGKRPAKAVALADVRERMLEDILETGIDERTQAMIAELRQAAAIRYASLPDLLKARKDANARPAVPEGAAKP